jgi:outer membrane protein assembly factor BamD
MLRFRLLILLVLLLSACAGTEEKSELLTLLGVDEQIVDTDHESENTYDALTLLKRGEAYFVKEDFLDAISEFERFLSLHPFHRMAAFSQYKLAMSYFQQIYTIDRDPAPMEKALAAFQKVKTQFPLSLYVDEATEKIAELEMRQGEHEFLIGQFYFRTKAYPAAVARFEKVLTRFDTGSLAEKTLFFLASTQFKAGNHEASLKTFEVLLTSYTDSIYKNEIEVIMTKMASVPPAS